MDKLTYLFNESLQTGYIDKAVVSDVGYQPEILTNQKNPPKKVLSSILHELDNCLQFQISVAFVTTGGVATIINKLKDLEKREIKGKVLVSQYLNFTQPEALRRLLQFKNIDLRIATKDKAHAKGYIFKRTDYYNIIIGSSNLTDTALSTNKEWNLKVSALDQSGIINDVLSEFTQDFANGTKVTDAFIIEYENIYENQKVFNKTLKRPELKNKYKEITPNSMQEEALSNLSKLRSSQQNKALLISATGTGKTYLSAFDAKEFAPKKLLFVVHRLTIARKALDTFKSIFSNDISMGLYSGKNKESECDFLFSTVQTISNPTHFEQFAPDHFDYIIVDESHRSGADSYLRLIEYFKPKFLLGMTATPERTDGQDIFQLFDHNIAYEIRLNRAMQEEMLSSFHYYGVTDLQVEDKVIDDKADFNLLTSEERVDRIIEQAKFYGSDNGITRGLIFCSGKDEAIELSSMFNNRGYRTLALTGENSGDDREAAIKKLETDDLEHKLDYIFTVDIFNEGIDIPKVNQIIMLRPTQSAIIFIQQLGRGLRKAEGKGYLTVIDFIGNYTNNYLIPIALYGDTSYNKDSIRRLITEGSRMIPGASTINFDEITKERIFESIDSTNMKRWLDLKTDYLALKNKLGRIPMMVDFIEHGSRDPYLFIEYSKSYYNFVCRVEGVAHPNLPKKLVKLLELFSREVNNAKRVEESKILNHLVKYKKASFNIIKETIYSKYKYSITDETIRSCLLNLNFDFIRKPEDILFEDQATIYLSKTFESDLENQLFRKFLVDSIKYSIKTFDYSFSHENYNDGLILYNKYSRKDVCRLLNWEKDISSTIYGYRTKDGVTPCFVTYHKSEDVESTIDYNDHFINPSTFAWESRSNRKIESNEIKNVINSNRILLFIKKADGEGTDFYYMGDTVIIPGSIKQDRMKDSQLPVVHFKFKLNKPVTDSIYQYITVDHIANTNENHTAKIDLNQEAKIINLSPDDRSTKTLRNPIPLYSFYAAAGSFSEMQSEKDYTLIEGTEKYNNEKDYFACRILGESMNRVIPNGSTCIFKKYTGGSRNGKILLVENFDSQDPDFNSAFTIKTYLSEKMVEEETSIHKSIQLLPNSYDDSFKPIVLHKENKDDLKIAGEFVQILED